MENIYVKENMEGNAYGVSFIKGQDVDIDAAFQRLTITKDMLKNYGEAINGTNTTDVTGRLRNLYNDLDFIARTIIKEELQLITKGA